MEKEFKNEIEAMFMSLSDEEVLSFVGWLLHLHGLELNTETKHRAADLLQVRLSRPNANCKRPAEEARRTFGCCSSATRVMKHRKQSRV